MCSDRIYSQFGSVSRMHGRGCLSGSSSNLIHCGVL